VSKIALAGFGAGLLLAALAPASAVEGTARPANGPPPPAYEGGSAFVPAAPEIMAPGSYPRGGCLVAENPREAAKGIRHLRPEC
jgi:hypothetical protein